MKPYGLEFTWYTGAMRNGWARQNKRRRATHKAQRVACRRAPKKAERREWRKDALSAA